MLVNEAGEPVEKFEFQRLSDDELREFVDDFLSDKLFTMHHLTPKEAETALGRVFLPIGLFGFDGCGLGEEDLKNVGTIYAPLSEAGPRFINGRPQFFSMRIMHKDDWVRVAAAIDREKSRRKSIEI